MKAKYLIVFTTFVQRLEAIHNKDYSVVKTSKAALTGRFFFLLLLYLIRFFHTMIIRKS